MLFFFNKMSNGLVLFLYVHHFFWRYLPNYVRSAHVFVFEKKRLSIFL